MFEFRNADTNELLAILKGKDMDEAEKRFELFFGRIPALSIEKIK